MLFFESVHRIEKTLADMCEVFGSSRPAFLAREISKVYEQYVRASLGGLLDAVQSGRIASKGEFVIAVGGAEIDAGPSLNIELLLRELKNALPLKQAAAIAAKVSGGRRNDLYSRLLEMDAND
jgi:16S rRNA (cytidine1402-2'-O)-methyltransferase